MGVEQDALRRTTRLMDFLADVTAAAERDPIVDILDGGPKAPDPVVWLDRLPAGIRLTVGAADGVVLRVRPRQLTAEPSAPPGLSGWLEPDEMRTYLGPPPRLVAAGPATDPAAQRAAPPESVVQTFRRWLAAWTQWSDQQRQVQQHRNLYEMLEQAAKLLEQQDDEFEMVLGTGLLRWQTPDGEALRRHLLVETVVPRLDRATAEITVVVVSGRRRLEERQLLGDLDGFIADRGRRQREEILDQDLPAFDPRLLARLTAWLGFVLDTTVDTPAHVTGVEGPLPGVPVLTPSPALLVRPRSRTLLAETYKQIAALLRLPGAQVPVSLAQLVTDTEPDQRRQWLTRQGAVSGDLLGADPLFPLPTNDEQRRVMDLLRTETGVVVQGPPGTGKTHTIANLVSALMARGQRVLVTSQKDQALRVLREKIPPELRRLCVLLAGGSKDTATELRQGLDALSAAIADPGSARLPQTITALAEQRLALQGRRAELNEQIQALRQVEYTVAGPVVPGFTTDFYVGTPGQLVRQVNQGRPRYGWMPAVRADGPDQPPLPAAEALALLRLLAGDSPARRQRLRQRIPAGADLPSPAVLAESVRAEHLAQTTADADDDPLVQPLAAAGAEALAELEALAGAVHTALERLRFDDHLRPPEGRRWLGLAVAQHLAGRHTGLWGHLTEIRGTAGQMQQSLQARGVGAVVELRRPLSSLGSGTVRGMLADGAALRAYLDGGGKLRRVLPSAAQKRAQPLLGLVIVDGQPPATVEQLDAVLDHLRAEDAVTQLAGKWADVRVEIPDGSLARRLSHLHDADRLLGHVLTLADTQQAIVAQLARHNIRWDLSSLTHLVRVAQAVPAARRHVTLHQARRRVNDLYARVRQWAIDDAACPELTDLLRAIGDRDVDGYRAGLDALAGARTDQDDAVRCRHLLGVLRAGHTGLADLLEQSWHQPQWPDQLADLPAAWAWSKTRQFLTELRNTDRERELVAEYDQIDDTINRLTAQLAAAEALYACLARMSDTHARALRSYREHHTNAGAGGGRKARDFRQAARAAMEKAKGAVPVWVVPLPNLLDNIPARPDAFDVIIVDEASQVGLEHLFLLWMAPRVIVVGDDQQCTPGPVRMGRSLDQIFDGLREHLGEIETEIRLGFTPKTNLYGLLTSRAGKDAVVRLREHFRCVPEIITWSSQQFYDDGAGTSALVPLRERRAGSLQPLHVVHVEGGFAERRDAAIRNPVEARRLVDQLLACLADPVYNGKTFGVVVLQGTGQIRLLEHEINAAVPAQVRVERRIRVGTPPNFQGDERDVVFLSTVGTETRVTRNSTQFKQFCNVAASRAKDQMWLFTSIAPGACKPGDLRGSLIDYMHRPPPVYGRSPDLNEVSDTAPTDPFESLFEQRVFRTIKERGYTVVPQFPVGSRILDLVVVGDGSRVAVECDGHQWHTSPGDTAADARRDRELRRMGWNVVRIRESEFEFDPDRELTTLWQHLHDHGIHPHTATEPTDSPWTPVTLPVDTDTDDEGTEP
ncbi:AAA domain-containing protein [Actinoplanes sp. NPDC026670]|uniref:AAA domain-containing protein n=1 Tax=Actinoplanes sp. NPDC026670 TaxID=3154700 RepID=UPI0033C78FB4